MVRRSGLVSPFVLIVAALVIAPATPWALELDVALTPGATQVSVGTEFEIRIDVTNQGPEFNTYGAVVGYDPAMLTFLQASPISLQEGAYMIAGCGNTYHEFEAQTASLNITHSLLCADTYRTGPGNLYILRFRADAPGNTEIRFDELEFYRAGFTTPLGTVTQANVEVTSSTDTGGAPVARLGLRAAPNPFNPSTVVSIVSPRSGFQRLLIHDSRGHLVRVLDSGVFAAGPRLVLWSGDGADGRRLASGVYLVTVETALESRTTRVVLVK